MEAFRNIYTVNQNKILIELPLDFNYNAVEVIVLPISENKTKIKIKKSNKKTKPNKKQQLLQLLTIGLWTDKDIEQILETNNLINQWKIEEF